jgi:hypothetical protein
MLDYVLSLMFGYLLAHQQYFILGERGKDK